MTPFISASRFAFNLNRSLAGLLLLLLLSSMTLAQSTTAVDGYTPLGLSPGAPAGSYGLSGFENVNLFNGNLNFSLPLLGVGGRGGASHMVLSPLRSPPTSNTMWQAMWSKPLTVVATRPP
jgi:hypothetical protein